MTICIAGICAPRGSEASIILCTDWLLTSDIGSSERMYKQRSLGKGFFLLPSGDEIEILAMKRTVSFEIRKLKDSYIEDDVLVAVRRGVQARKKEKSEEYTLGMYGIFYDDFIQYGKERFPENLYQQELLNIREIRAHAECIVVGFCNGFPLLINTTDIFQANIVEECCAVGSGSYLATASLMHRNFSEMLDFNQALYLIWEAKKYSERVKSVGEQTGFTILKKDGAPRVVNGETRHLLNQMYKDLGPKEMPGTLEIPQNIFIS